MTSLPLASTPAGVMFHHFHGGRFPASQGSISAAELDAMITAIGRERILSAREWLRRAEAGALQAGDLCFTFDDNLMCQYEVALPVLRHHGITAFWFVYTSVNQGNPERLEIYRHFRTVAFPSVDAFYQAFDAFIAQRPEGDEVAEAIRRFDPDAYLADYSYLSRTDKIFRYTRDRVLGRARYEAAMDDMLVAYGFDMATLFDLLWMGDRHLAEMHAEGHVIGLHSHSHPTTMGDLPPHEQRSEFEANAAHIAQVTGERPRTVSHPNNSYSQATLDILASMGIVLGFRANMTPVVPHGLTLPRHNHALVHRAVQAQPA